MYLIGDIGNTEIKIFLFNNSYKIKKKIIFKTAKVSNKYLASKLFFLKKESLHIKKILFSSVVPSVYSTKKIHKKKF